MIKYQKYKGINILWAKEIPSHWHICRISNIFGIRREKNKPVRTKEVLSLSAMYGVSLYSDKKEKGGNKPKEDFSSYNLCYPGDILVNCMNIVSGAVGISKYFGAVSPVYYPLVNLDKEKYDTRFMEYIFRNYNFQRGLVGIGKGIQMSEAEDGRLFTVRMRISWENLKVQMLIVPTIEEQQQIANYLDWKIGEIDKLIEIEKKKLDELEELIFNKIDRYILKIKNNSSQHIKLRYLYSFQNGISTSKDYKTGKYPFLTYSDVYNNLVIPRKLSGKIDSTPEERKVYSIKKGDLFFTRTSERLEDAGKVSLADKSVSYSVFNGFTIRLRPNNRTVFLDKFILYYLNSNLVRESFIGTLNIVTRVSIKQELLKNIEIPFIPKDEQRKLINHIELMFKNSTKIIELSKNKISFLSELKQSLISEVVTGQIDVRNVKILERK